MDVVTRMGALLVFLAFAVGDALADPKPAFTWALGFYEAEFPECGQVQIQIGTLPSMTTSAVPPYTLIAYEAGGIATVQNLGSDPSNLLWTVDHKAGAQLLISMADSVGNSGGISKTVYTVISNATTNSSCHPISPTSPVSLTTNSTSSINPCDVLSFKISGGQRPYQVSLVSALDFVVTNVIMNDSYDTYNWVNRASQDSSLIATVSDATGAYAVGTGLLKTGMFGSGPEHNCNGMQSTQIDSTGHYPPLQSGSTTSTASTSSPTSKSSDGPTTPTAPIVGGVVGGLVFIGALAAGIFFFPRRRRARGPRAYNEFGPQNTSAITPFRPDSYMDASPRTAEVTPNANNVVSGGHHPKHGVSAAAPHHPSPDSNIGPLLASGSDAAAPVLAQNAEGGQTENRGRLPLPPPEARQPVYQHADISDIVELPPAYRGM